VPKTRELEILLGSLVAKNQLIILNFNVSQCNTYLFQINNMIIDNIYNIGNKLSSKVGIEQTDAVAIALLSLCPYNSLLF